CSRPAHPYHNQATENWCPAEAAVSLDADAGEAQLLEGGQQLERESVFDPILVDDGRDLGLHEGAHLLENRQLIGAQGLREAIEVAVRRRQRLRLPIPGGCGGPVASPFDVWACLQGRVYSTAGVCGAGRLVRSSMRPSRISSRSPSSSSIERDPTSAWTLSVSFFCTSGVSTGEPRVFHQAVIGPLNCWKKCSMPPGPPP